MKIEIKQCSHAHYWYADKVGESFPLVGLDKHEIRESSSSSNSCYVVVHDNKEHVVIIDDCEVI